LVGDVSLKSLSPQNKLNKYQSSTHMRAASEATASGSALKNNTTVLKNSNFEFSPANLDHSRNLKNQTTDLANRNSYLKLNISGLGTFVGAGSVVHLNEMSVRSPMMSYSPTLPEFRRLPCIGGIIKPRMKAVGSDSKRNMFDFNKN
jgi:hypothetical protein